MDCPVSTLIRERDLSGSDMLVLENPHCDSETDCRLLLDLAAVIISLWPALRWVEMLGLFEDGWCFESTLHALLAPFLCTIGHSYTTLN